MGVTESIDYLSALPEDLKVEICTYLRWDGIRQVQRLSRGWNKTANNEKIFWDLEVPYQLVSKYKQYFRTQRFLISDSRLIRCLKTYRVIYGGFRPLRYFDPNNIIWMFDTYPQMYSSEIFPNLKYLITTKNEIMGPRLLGIDRMDFQTRDLNLVADNLRFFSHHVDIWDRTYFPITGKRKEKRDGKELDIVTFNYESLPNLELLSILVLDGCHHPVDTMFVEIYCGPKIKDCRIGLNYTGHEIPLIGTCVSVFSERILKDGCYRPEKLMCLGQYNFYLNKCKVCAGDDFQTWL